MDDLIFDRTQADVTYAKENQSSENNLKGAYNYTDLNRIEQWCAYLATELSNIGYQITITTKTDWTGDDFPTANQLERIRSNVSNLKAVFYANTNVPTNMNKMTIAKANAIEKILDELNNNFIGTKEWFVHSGVANSGQARLFQHRFR